MTRTAVGQAPGRVNLIGEHTDYNAGLCLPFALSHTTTATIRERDDDRVRIVSQQTDDPWTGTLDRVGPGQVEGWSTYAVGVVWALQQAGWVLPGLDIEIDSTVPVGAGLSSSAALECSVAVAVCGLLGQELTTDLRRMLVEVCRRAESEVARAPTGGLDQTVSMLASAGTALLIDFEDGSTREVPLAVDGDGLTLLVTDTRVSHSLTDGGYAARREDCEAAVATLGLTSLRQADKEAVDSLADPRLRARARHVVSENARVVDAVTALSGSDWASLGGLMAGSHASLRDDYEVSCAELDTVAAAAVAAGAIGSRMTGGGFGGSTITLLRQDSLDEVTSAIDSAFATAGYRAPRHLEAVPSPAAYVVSVSG